MHSARPLRAARAPAAAARPLGRCLRCRLSGGGGGEAAWRRLLPLQRQSNQRGAQAARRVPSAIRAPAACLALRRRLGCAVAPGVAAFRLLHCARGALQRACGRLHCASHAQPAAPGEHAPGEAALCAALSAAVSNALAPFYVGRGDEGDHRWAPFSLPVVAAPATGAATKPASCSAIMAAPMAQGE